MYANRQIVEEKAAAAAMVGGAPQPSAATFAPEIAVPQPQRPAVAAPYVATEAKCREFFETVSAWQRRVETDRPHFSIRPSLDAVRLLPDQGQ